MGPMNKEKLIEVARTARENAYCPYSRFMVGAAVLGENGKVDPKKLQPITYDPMNHHYLVLGDAVGQAFHDGLSLK